VDEDKANAVAAHLVSDDLFSGWGVRTLAASNPAFNPVSYHCGSVWPHDNALIAAGLMRYGHVDEAHRIIDAMLDVADAMGGRLPELFAGTPRTELGVPAAYPTSCSPQAWASATPLAMLRTLLRLDPWLPHKKVWLAPAQFPRFERLHVDGIPLGGSRANVHVDGGELSVTGLASDVDLVPEPRHPLFAPTVG
jgi:glycogen debranching enzyme